MMLLHLESLPPRITKGELLHFLITTGGIRREQVGRIELRGSLATIEVPSGWADRLVKVLDGVTLQGHRLHASSKGSPMRPSVDGDYFQRLAHLLKLESETEAQQTLEKMRRLSPAEAENCGDCLVELVITEESSGLGGRCL